MPLIYNDTTYNYSNTKNINLDSTNEVKILQYKKIYELKTVKIGSNGITDVDGTTFYQVSVKEQLYGNFDSIGFELKSNSTCQYNITSYDEETGIVNISIKSSLPKSYFAILKTKEPYSLILGIGQRGSLLIRSKRLCARTLK